MKHIKIAALVLVTLFFGCGQATNSPTDNATSGSIHIVVDDAYKPLMDAEQNVFQALYPNAHVSIKYETEDLAIKDLMASDSVRFAVVARKLTKSEVDYFSSMHFFPEQVKIATDAMALIVNNTNADSLISLDKVKAIFNGQDSTWTDVNPRSKLDKIAVVFDHENSSNSHYIRDSIVHGKKFPAYCFALKSNTEVINYVSKNPNAIGIISINWISDNYDSTVMRFLSNVKVVGISHKESTNINDFYQPFQAYLKMNEYPFCRNVYIIKREARTGLGSGFTAFISGEKGQRIVLREGLLPATVPTEIIRY